MTGEFDLAFGYEGCQDSEWFARATWQRVPIRLQVSDDRRGRLVEVFMLRPLVPDELFESSIVVRREDVALPLWVIVESRGGNADFFLSGAHRLDKLPLYAQAVHDFARPLLTNRDEPLANVVGVVKQRNWDSWEEGRKARRWLP